MFAATYMSQEHKGLRAAAGKGARVRDYAGELTVLEWTGSRYAKAVRDDGTITTIKLGEFELLEVAR